MLSAQRDYRIPGTSFILLRAHGIENGECLCALPVKKEMERLEDSLAD
jgi:hypothetical protein